MMASRALHPVQAAPLDVLLSAIPSLPRAVLARLTDRLIEQMDAMDPDPDVEDSEAGNSEIDARGRWCGVQPYDGPWFEDDEDGNDRELTDEREPELYEGGQRDPPLPHRFHITA